MAITIIPHIYSLLGRCLSQSSLRSHLFCILLTLAVAIIAFGLALLSEDTLQGNHPLWGLPLRTYFRGFYNLLTWFWVGYLTKACLYHYNAIVASREAYAYRLFHVVGVTVSYMYATYLSRRGLLSSITTMLGQDPNSVFLRNWNYGLMIVIALALIKLRGHWLAKREPDRFRGLHVENTPLFTFTWLGFAMYWASYLLTGLPSAIIVMVSLIPFLAAVFHFVRRYRLWTTDCKLHLDLQILFYSSHHVVRGLTRAMYMLLETKPGQRDFAYVIMAYRMMYSGIVMVVEDIVLPAYGVAEMWVAFALRVGEHITSTFAAANTAPSLEASAVYMATNLLASIIKDTGIIDDLRFLIRNKYWVYTPLARFFREKGHPDRFGRASMSMLLRPVSTASASGFKAGREGDSFAASENSTRMARERVQEVSQDVRLQIARSEQTLLARIVGLVTFLGCYGLCIVTKRTVPNKLKVRPTGDFAPELIALLAAEIVVSRLIAYIALRWKLSRLERLRSVVDGVGGEKSMVSKSCLAVQSVAELPTLHSSSALDLVNLTNTAALKSAASLMMASPLTSSVDTPPSRTASNASAVVKGKPALPLLPKKRANLSSLGSSLHLHGEQQPTAKLELWSTKLPSDPRMLELIVVATAFVTSVQLGPWTT